MNRDYGRMSTLIGKVCVLVLRRLIIRNHREREKGRVKGKEAKARTENRSKATE